MDRRHHAGDVVRTGHRKHRRMRVPDHSVLRAEATGDDHAAVLGERLADRPERLLDRGVDKAAGIDDHEVGTAVGRAIA